MKTISDVLSDTKDLEELSGFPDDISTSDFPYFKYATFTPVDVGHLFSRYKTLLSNNRRSFELENIPLIPSRNLNNLDDDENFIFMFHSILKILPLSYILNTHFVFFLFNNIMIIIIISI